MRIRQGKWKILTPCWNIQTLLLLIVVRAFKEHNQIKSNLFANNKDKKDYIKETNKEN